MDLGYRRPENRAVRRRPPPEGVIKPCRGKQEDELDPITIQASQGCNAEPKERKTLVERCQRRSPHCGGGCSHQPSSIRRSPRSYRGECDVRRQRRQPHGGQRRVHGLEQLQPRNVHGDRPLPGWNQDGERLVVHRPHGRVEVQHRHRLRRRHEAGQ